MFLCTVSCLSGGALDAATVAPALQVRVCGGVVGQVTKIGFRTTQIRVKIDGESELLFCHQLVEVHFV